MSEFYDKIESYRKTGKTYVVAEVGSNFKSEDDLLGSIALAKNCGADAVKFQYFTEGELYGPTYEVNKTFPLSRLKIKSDAVGIDFLCSAFSPEGVAEVDKFVPAHKIASSEMSHIRLLEAVKKAGKPLILSTGGSFLTDIKRVCDFMGDGYPLILMHCNLKYPTRFSDLKKFNQLKDAWSGVVGYSDHTTSVDAVPLMYSASGAAVLEKHFNPFGYTDTPDADHSLGREEFKTMVSYLNGEPNDYNEENEGRLKYLRRVVALKDIQPGDVLTEGDNIGIFRAREADANGANPFFINRIEGKKASVAIKAGAGVSVSNVLK